MRKLERIVLIVSVAAWAVAVGGIAAAAEEDGAAGLRVGIFDSRAVAIAYAQSAPFQECVRSMKAEYRRAKEAGDEERARELEERGQDHQHLLHKQGFGTWPVDDILEMVQDEIPDLARAAGVDLIVSRWDVVYLRPGAELIDVTEFMVRPFDPSPEMLAGLDEIRKVDPVPLEELESHRH